MNKLPLHLANIGAEIVVENISLGDDIKKKLHKFGVFKNKVANVVFKSKISGVVLRIEGFKIAISNELSKNIFFSHCHVAHN